MFYSIILSLVYNLSLRQRLSTSAKDIYTGFYDSGNLAKYEQLRDEKNILKNSGS